MPSYELMMLVRNLPKPNVIECVRRVGSDIIANRGIVRKIEYLGLNKIPHPIPDKMCPKDRLQRLKEGNYFLIHFDSSTDVSSKMCIEKVKMDTEIIRHMIARKEQLLPEDYECTLADELKPPPYRESVQNLIKEGRVEEPKYKTGHFNNW